MTTGPTQPAPDQAPAVPAEPRPTFQTAASEAADVASRAVAEQVAATAAARAAAAEAAAEREAAEARAAEERAASERAAAERAAAEQAAAVAASVNDAMLAADATIAATAADGSTAASGMPATATIPTVPAPEAAAVPAAPVASVVPATPKVPRRPVVIAWTRRLVVFALGVALLVGGLMLGSTTFQRTRAVPVAGGAEEFTQPPADVAKEFIRALGAGDSDGIRSSLSEEPNKDLVDEFSKFGIKKVTGVETLGTSVDGPRSATEVLLHTVDTDGNRFDINLIILVNGNTIEGFR